MEKVSNELISVIVPVYNVENYLDKCVKSIVSQTYDNIEIILVDDGSSDKCPKICDQWAKKDKRIRVFHKENGGLSDARNVGVDNSKGKYITFIDSDDYITNNYVELLFDTLTKYNTDMSIGGHFINYEKGFTKAKFSKDEYASDPETILEKMLYDDGIDLTACAKLYKRNLFNDVRFPVGRLYEDAATTYKLIAASKKIGVNTEPIYYYVIKANSITNSDFQIRKMDLIISTNEMTSFIRKKYPNLKSACDRRDMYAYLSTYNQLNKASKRNKEIEKKLVSYIKKNKGIILKDKRTPKRDKFGIICVCLGYYFYKVSWNLYKLVLGKRY